MAVTIFGNTRGKKLSTSETDKAENRSSIESVSLNALLKQNYLRVANHSVCLVFNTSLAIVDCSEGTKMPHLQHLTLLVCRSIRQKYSKSGSNVHVKQDY